MQRLGDDLPKTREEAESKLFELGPVAVPALEDALRNKDVEIVFRAERAALAAQPAGAVNEASLAIRVCCHPRRSVRPSSPRSSGLVRVDQPVLSRSSRSN